MDNCTPDLMISDKHEVNEPFKMSQECGLIKTTLFVAGRTDLMKLFTDKTAPKPEALYPQKYATKNQFRKPVKN